MVNLYRKNLGADPDCDGHHRLIGDLHYAELLWIQIAYTLSFVIKINWAWEHILEEEKNNCDQQYVIKDRSCIKYK